MPECLSIRQPVWCPRSDSSEHLHHEHHGFNNRWSWGCEQHSGRYCHGTEHIYWIWRIFAYWYQQIFGCCPGLWSDIRACHGACWCLWGLCIPAVGSSPSRRSTVDRSTSVQYERTVMILNSRALQPSRTAFRTFIFPSRWFLSSSLHLHPCIHFPLA